MAGGYLFKMWGLPAAAIAIWHCARPENRAKVGGIMISAALTAFLTGITEPIEFAFLFVAPVLYVIHALLVGVAYFLCIELGVKHGMTFSHGVIDYVVLFAEVHPWLVAAGDRSAVGAALLHDLPHRHPQVRPQDAGPRSRGESSRADAQADVATGFAQATGAGLRRTRQHQEPGRLHHPAAGGAGRHEQGQPGQAQGAGRGRRRGRSATACRRSSARAPRT